MFCCCNKTTKHKDVDIAVNIRGNSANTQTVSICDTAKSGVYIEIEKQRIHISEDAIEVKIINNTDKDIEYGDIYYIEKRDVDKWNRIALDKDTLGNLIASNLVGYTLKPNSFIKKTCNMVKCAYHYGVGKYQIVIPYIQNGINMERSAEFTLIKDCK